MKIHSKPSTDASLKREEHPKDTSPDHSSLNALANLVSEQWNQVRSRPNSHLGSSS